MWRLFGVPTSEHFVSLIDMSSFSFDQLKLELTIDDQ
jgi:hypothetical protein